MPSTLLSIVETILEAAGRRPQPHVHRHQGRQGRNARPIHHNSHRSKVRDADIDLVHIKHGINRPIQRFALVRRPVRRAGGSARRGPFKEVG